MKHHSPLTVLLTVVLALILAACDSTFGGPTATLPATPTDTPTTVPPTQTPLPPTATLTPIVFTDTPIPIPPTATMAPPTPVLPTPTRTRVPTRSVIEPEPRAKFEGTFDGGTLVLRIGQNSQTIIPKLVTVRKAECKEGKTFSDTISFEPPPTFPIVDGKFTISVGNQVLITGQFSSSTKANGSIELRLKGEGKVCTIGPVNWTASAS